MRAQREASRVAHPEANLGQDSSRNPVFRGLRVGTGKSPGPRTESAFATRTTPRVHPSSGRPCQLLLLCSPETRCNCEGPRRRSRPTSFYRRGNRGPNNKRDTGAGGIAQWSNGCLTRMRPWVPSPGLKRRRRVMWVPTSLPVSPVHTAPSKPASLVSKPASFGCPHPWVTSLCGKLPGSRHC